MQSQNRFFDDLAKVLNGVAGTVAGLSREAESSARERAKEWVELSQALQRIKDILIKSEYMYPFKSELSALLAKRLRKLSP